MFQVFSKSLRSRAIQSFPRSDNWWRDIACNYTDAEWMQNFRLSKPTFNYICRSIGHSIARQDTTFRKCIPIVKRVAIAIFQLASTTEYRVVGSLFGVSRSTVCNCVREFCRAVIDILMPKFIRIPTPAEMEGMATFFEERWGLPQCIGAIDGSHIPIMRPPKFPTDYHNRKGWHSIVVQAIVDGKGSFWDLCVGSPGSTHDARILRRSAFHTLATSGLFPGKIKRVGDQDIGYYILGDSAYPLQSWLLKPFIDNGRLSQDQQLYNTTTSRARAVVEHAFGRLKGRWRCLMKRNDCNIELVKDMVLASCVLHNLCEKHCELFDPEWTVAEPQSFTAPVLDDMPGQDIRNALITYIKSLKNAIQSHPSD